MTKMQMDETGLFRCKRAVTDTSRAAFKSVKHKIGGLHDLILNHVDERGERGSTMDEACMSLGLLPQTASARFNELLNNGEIEDTGRRRRTRHGKKARVYTMVKR